MIYLTVGGIPGAGVTLLGYALGNVPFVKDNIELILIAVVGISVLPIVYEYIRHKREVAAIRRRWAHPTVVAPSLVRSAQAYMAIAAAAPALIERVDPVLRDVQDLLAQIQ